MNTSKFRLCIIGNLLGRNPNRVTTQGQIVADLLAFQGYEVISASAKIGRVSRFVDIVSTILCRGRTSDLLIAEVYSSLGFLLADSVSTLSRVFRIPLIFVLHGGNLPDFAERHPGWVKRVLRRADVLVVPSTYLADKMACFGFNVQVIPNVIDTDVYDYRLRSHIFPKLLWMRSFHPIYNPQMALDVASALKCDIPDVTLVMAGVDKGLQETIEKSAHKMGLIDAVRFPGFLDEESKIREFSAADIYINTNRIDNMPVSVVEAMAMGLPVVSTNVGGLSHMITHGENGLLVKDGAADEMANAIIELLKSPELVERLSRNGRLTAENCGWSSVRRSWERLFTDLLEQKSKSKGSRKLQSFVEP